MFRLALIALLVASATAFAPKGRMIREPSVKMSVFDDATKEFAET